MSERTPISARCMWMRGGTSKGGYFLAEDLPARRRDARRVAARRDGLARQAADRRHGRRRSADLQGGGGLALDPRRRRRRLSVPAGVRRQADRHRRAELRQHAGRRRPVRDRARPGRGDRRRDCGDDLHGQHRPGRRGARSRRRAASRPTTATARIDGVPGTAAPIPIEFRGAAGSSCGALLPTGRARRRDRRRRRRR